MFDQQPRVPDDLGLPHTSQASSTTPPSILNPAATRVPDYLTTGLPDYRTNPVSVPVRGFVLLLRAESVPGYTRRQVFQSP